MNLNLHKIYGFVILSIVLVSIVSMYVERKSHEEDVQRLANVVAKTEGLRQEAEKSWSSRAVEIENLKLENKTLQRTINARDEEIVGLSELVLRWKTKYFKINDARETTVASDGTTVTSLSPDCTETLRDVRFRVDFEQTQDALKAFGYTLTNPPYAEVAIEWIRGVKMNLILTKTHDDKFRIYLDSETSDVVPAQLNLKIDPEVFQKKWYEKIAVGTDLAFGPGVVSSLKLTYDILDDVYLGPTVMFFYDGIDLRTLYGVSVGHYPFR